MTNCRFSPIIAKHAWDLQLQLIFFALQTSVWRHLLGCPLLLSLLHGLVCMLNWWNPELSGHFLITLPCLFCSDPIHDNLTESLSIELSLSFGASERELPSSGWHQNKGAPPLAKSLYWQMTWTIQRVVGSPTFKLEFPLEMEANLQWKEWLK